MCFADVDAPYITNERSPNCVDDRSNDPTAYFGAYHANTYWASNHATSDYR